MDDEAGEAQALALLAELNGFVAEISLKLEAVDSRNQQAQRRGIARACEDSLPPSRTRSGAIARPVRPW